MGHSELKLLLSSVIICLVFHKVYSGDPENVLDTESSSKNEEESQINAPLIVVSNRLPFVLDRNSAGKLKRKASAGGLVTALAPVVVTCNGTWIGWSGIFDLQPTEQIPEADPKDYTPTAGLKSSQVIPVYIEKNEFDEYYNGICNSMLWPLFHSMPDRVNFVSKDLESYYKVNEKFAIRTLEALRKIIKSLDEKGENHIVPIVWIHDYQLLLAGTIIRQVSEKEKLRCKLGYFLHIPFPSWDMMKIISWDDQILQGILAFDFVAFHIEDYCLNFIDCCSRRLGCLVDRTHMLINYAGRTIQVKALPIGVPFEHFKQMAENAPTLLDMSKNIRYILGVDRLDYTKGIVNRLLTFEIFLKKYPQYQGKVVLYQVSVPSRVEVPQYAKLKADIDGIIGRINGSFSKINWTPISYIYNYLTQDDLAGLYRDSTVALVTPLRDGMNLVSKEFVACQVNSPGVLVLSKLAGASEYMKEALLVNPYDMDNMANMLYRALQMSDSERKIRMVELRKREQEYDVNYWMASFFSMMGSLKSIPLKMGDFDSFLANHLAQGSTFSVILDYEDTLVESTSQSIMSDEMKQVLKRLSTMPDVNIAIISNHTLKDLMSTVDIHNITYAGNRGLEIHQPDGTQFIQPIPKAHEQNLIDLQEFLKEVTVDGARVEIKNSTLTYIYNDVPLDKREYLKKQATEIFKNAEYVTQQKLFNIVATPSFLWNKGGVALYILRTTYGLDWNLEGNRIIYAGDEEAMSTLQGIACTFLVDPLKLIHTDAQHRLSGPEAVFTMLIWLESYMIKRGPTLQKAVSYNRLQSFKLMNSFSIQPDN